jgi:hypothetical protein
MTKLDEAGQREMARDYLAGELTTKLAQERTSTKGKGGAATKQSKKWTQGGVTLNVTYGKGVTLADVAEVLEERAKLLRSDGRAKRAA